MERTTPIKGKYLWVNLSKDPLTDENGYITTLESFNTILLFPQLVGDQDQFLITYLHPGNYYVNIIADVNEDGAVTTGDYTHPLKSIVINPEGQHQITIDNITVEN